MFELTPLPFGHGALMPRMSRETLEIHHGKHHASYVKKTNELIAAAHYAPMSLEEVVRRASENGDQDLFNNAAQAWNHGFFWQCLAPAPQPPGGDLAAALDRSFGSRANFETEFCDAGVGHFGSGWLWLVATPDGSVSLEATHDAQTPIVDSGTTPLLVCDLWEHAYYLDYKNKRLKFLKAFVGALAHWRFAESQYAAARKGEAGWSYPGPAEAKVASKEPPQR